MSGRSSERRAGATQLVTLILGVCTSAAVSAQAQQQPEELATVVQPSAAAALTPAAAEAQPPLAETEHVAAQRMVRNLVVPQFVAPAKSRARAAVLRTLADHNEVEVVSIDDVTFAARRLQADPNTPDGRAKLSRELGIDAWLDGKVTETSAQLTLTSGDGTLLQAVSVESDDEKVLDALTGERMWAALGPRLSLQEAYRRAVLAEYERARHKFEARLVESHRQVQLAHKARAQRAFVLRAQFSLAQRKQAALVVAQERQTGLGRAELAREAEAARQAELARQAEAARKLELARQQADARKVELAKRREDAKAAAHAKAEAKQAAAQAKTEAKTAAAEAKAKAKNDRKLAKTKRRGGSTSLTNTGAQRAHARAVAKKKAKAQAKALSTERAAQRRAAGSAANSGKGPEAPQLISEQ